MAYENLDSQDRAICEALERGVTVSEIMAQFDVTEDKVASLRPVVEEKLKMDTEKDQNQEGQSEGEGQEGQGEGSASSSSEGGESGSEG